MCRPGEERILFETVSCAYVRKELAPAVRKGMLPAMYLPGKQREAELGRVDEFFMNVGACQTLAPSL